MKKKLLSLIAMALVAIGMQAQWTAPVEPESPFKGVDYEADGSTGYYIYNVGCGQFVTGANAWATQISLGTESNPYMEIVVEALTGEDAETYPNCVKIKMNGTFYFTGGNNRKDYEVSNKYLFRDGDANGFIDHNNQAVWYWLFEKAESGNYYWHSAPGMGDNKFPNAAEEYAAGKGAGAAVVFNGSAEDSNIEWAFVPAATLDKDAIPAYAAAMNLYEARLELYNKYLEAVELGVNTDAAAVVYNNADATIEEITAAYEDLAAYVLGANVGVYAKDAAEDNPVDITNYVIVNPDFENGQKPWTITSTMGQNLQVQGTGYPNDGNGNPAEGYDSFVMKNFIEAWYPTNVGPLKDGVICQTVKGLPEGRYRIECDAIAVWQGEESALEATGGEQKGVYLFYNNGSYTIHSESMSTGNGIPEHFTFDFDYSGAASMTIGLMTENTNCNWMGMDNFRLYALGECKDSPSYTALLVEYNSVKEYAEDVEYAEAALIDQMQEALEAAEDLVNGESDKEKDAEYIAAFDALKTAMDAVVASEQAYKKLATFIERLEKEAEEYNASATFKSFAEEIINPLLDQCKEAYEDGTWNAEQIDAAIADYEPKAKEFTQKVFDAAAAANEPLEEPIDITVLFDYMDFGNSSTATNYGKGYPAANEETGVTPVWVPVNESGVAKEEGNFKLQYGTAEVWNNRPFNISREFKNLPKGRYTIQTNAFFRAKANDENYAGWVAAQEEGVSYYKNDAYLYAGDNKAPIINVAAFALTPEEEERATALKMSLINEEFYVPNNQQSGSLVFTDPELSQTTLVSVGGNVLNEGDVLRVGVAGTSNLGDNSWTLWYGFKLFYNGAVTSDALNEDLQALIDQTTEIASNPVEYGNVAETGNVLAQAIDKGTAALEATDTETKIAAMNTLNEAIAEAEKSLSLLDELWSTYQTYNAMKTELGSTYTDEAYPALMAEVEGVISEVEAPQSNAQIEQWIKDLKTKWYDYVLSDEAMATATIAKPADMSALIVNPSFTTKDFTGWTYTVSRGNPGVEESSDFCAEFWNTGTFDIYQELPKLADGYWQLEVDALYRPGNSDNVKVVLETPDSVLLDNEFLYADGTGLGAAVRVMQWTDTQAGAYKYTLDEENLDEEGKPTKVFDDDEAEFIEGGLDMKTTAFNFIAPNNRTGFKAFVENGRYHNVLTFRYAPENGAVKLGLKLTDDITKGSCWCPFDDFKLSFLGTTAPDAIGGIIADEPISQKTNAIYNLNGQRVSKAVRGLYIINGKKVVIK